MQETAFVHDLIDARARLMPQRRAMLDADGNATSYEALAERSNQLANLLSEINREPGRMVLAMTGKCPELVVSLLAIMKAGQVYVPFDPKYTDQQLEEWIKRTQPVAAVVNQSFIKRFTRVMQQSGTGEIPLIVFGDDAEFASSEAMPPNAISLSAIADYPATRPEVSLTPRSAAYVFFTSGSEGKPKGVVGCHGSLTHFVSWEAKAFDVTEADGFSQLGALSSDATLKDILVPLASGACVCLPGENDVSSGVALLDWISKREISVLGCVPTLFREILEAVEMRRVEAKDDLKHLRLVLLAGETLQVGWVRRWMSILGQTKVANLYGATEATVFSVYHLMTTPPADGVHAIPVGKGIEGTEIVVLNRSGRRCSVGEVGEIYLKSDYLSLGYLDDPESTSRSFTADASRPEDGATMYRTGDLGRLMPTGELEFIGRKDGQVKIRGYRVEMGEVSSVVNESTHVKRAAVVCFQDQLGNNGLRCFYTTTGSTEKTDMLREYLSERLPAWMIPAEFYHIETMPLLPNGKIDQQSLAALVTAPQSSTINAEQSEPSTPREKFLVEVWKELLNRQHVGLDQNFFELGGHSLMAMRMLNRIYNSTRLRIPLLDIFEHNTIRALAVYLDKLLTETRTLEQPEQASSFSSEDGHSSATLTIRPAARHQNPVLSFSQQRLWFLEQLQPDSAFYNVVAAVRLSGSLRVTALEQSFNKIVERHEILRTTFPAIDGEPVQRIAPPTELKLHFVNLEKLLESERENEMLRRTAEEARRSFNLAQGPLLRISLFRLNENEHVLLLVMHHIISDGWSMGVLIEEMAALYQAYVNDEQAALADLPVQYADFAVWQREWLRGGRLASQLAYWKRQLAGISVLKLPTDRPRPAVQTFRGARQSITLHAPLASKLKRLSQDEGATLFMTLLAAFKALLYRYTGQEDIAVGTGIANRNPPETEKLIGFFVNTLALRTDLSGNPSFRELLGRVRETAMSAYAHQDLPFEKLVEELQPERDLSYGTLLQVIFLLQNTPMPPLELKGLTLTRLDVDAGAAKFDLAFGVTEAEDDLLVTAEYNTDLFDGETINQLLKHFEIMLEEVAARPESRLLDIPLHKSQADNAVENIHRLQEADESEQFNFDYR